LTSAVHQIICKPDGRVLEVREGETILAAAQRNELLMPHSCRNGMCGTCKGKIVEGTVDYGTYQPGALSDSERHQGYALFCQARPLSDLTIECRLIKGAAGITVRKLASRVLQLERIASDVMRIRLRLPANHKLRFLAGQYMDILTAGLRRSLSLANPPHEDEILELHLRDYGGPFSKHVFKSMKEGDLLRLEGPLGTFFVRDDSVKPMIFVASGTGFAPIKGMIEHEIRKGSSRPMTLYWGGRRPGDLYLSALAEDWVKSHGVGYVPVVSDATSDDAWSGRTGFVHRAVMEDLADLSGHQVYACGAPIVVQSAREDFVSRCNLPSGEFFADAFLPSSGATSPLQQGVNA
jgi:CDP-4-dehydro-6-deoxyglucose reductase, E3